jgi:hypothetical protein
MPDESLTKAGTPRKNKPGAGRPEAGRSVGLPRISPGKRQVLALVQQGLAHGRGGSVSAAEAVEASISMAADVLLGVDPRRWIAPGK